MSNVTTTLLCQGNILAKGKLHCVFVEVVDGKIVGEPMSWDKFTGSPGVVYTVRVDEKWAEGVHTIFTTGRRVEREWEDAAQVLEWTARDKTAKIAHQQERVGAKVEREAVDVLAGLREAYWGTAVSQRPAFLAFVISQITKGI